MLRSRMTIQFWTTVLIILLLRTNTLRSAQVKHVLNIGVILPANDSYEFSIGKMRPVMDVAMETIRDQHLLRDYTFNLTYADSGPDISTAPDSAYNIYADVGQIRAFFGPVTDDALAPVAMQAKFWYIPVLTSGGVSEAFEEHRYFSTLVSLATVKAKHVARVIEHLMLYYNWDRAKLLYTPKAATGMGSVCYQLPPAIKAGDERHTLKHEESVSIHHAYISDNYAEMLKREVGAEFAIVVLCAAPDVVRDIMATAQRLKFNNGYYVFIVLDLFRSYTETYRPWHRAADTAKGNEAAMKSFEYVINIGIHRPSTHEHHNVSRRIKARAASHYNDTRFSGDIDDYLGVFYDSLVLLAAAINDTKEHGHNISQSMLVKHMLAEKYEGITGHIEFDSLGNRLTGYSIFDMIPKDGTYEVVADYYSNTNKFTLTKKMHWGYRYNTAPSDKPGCTYDSTCTGRYKYLEVIVISLTAFFVCASILSYFLYRRYKHLSALSTLAWRIKWDEVKIESGTDKKRVSLKRSLDSFPIDRPPSDEQRFTQIAVVRGTRVSVKFLKRSTFHIDRVALGEIKMMMDIENDNICKFFGACIDQPNQSIMSEYCKKGSLQDLLENEQIKLDWVFRFSLVQDIAKGMAFIHSSVFRSHGDLRSSNCLVDGRFVLKLTDFGLHFLRDDVIDETDHEFARNWKRLWTAPELLRKKDSPCTKGTENGNDTKGTQKGDVYGFAIVCQEIVYRLGVFYIDTAEYISNKDKILNVKQGGEPYFRPTLRSEDCSQHKFYELILKCWSEEPEDRPTFNEILHLLHRVNRTMDSGNIMDNLLRRMEAYATDLESLIAQKTEAFMAEKQRGDEILHLMLPQSVAKQLIDGHDVSPETYDCATIFFSDIVGFTALSASCTPMDIIGMLNDLYTLFDSIADNFDVYKVETIGDAYMVVSGLPVRNGIHHAGEIGWMAIELLAAVKQFRIRFRPEAELRLRIGLHSGPVCAGVVGRKMPRYCLFGNTVTTAASYESSGLPLKIHISEDTKRLLDKLGHFEVILRCEMEMKNAGKVKTYWLLGANTPDITPAASGRNKQNMIFRSSIPGTPYVLSAPSSRVSSRRASSLSTRISALSILTGAISPRVYGEKSPIPRGSDTSTSSALLQLPQADGLAPLQADKPWTNSLFPQMGAQAPPPTASGSAKPAPPSTTSAFSPATKKGRKTKTAPPPTSLSREPPRRTSILVHTPTTLTTRDEKILKSIQAVLEETDEPDSVSSSRSNVPTGSQRNSTGDTKTVTHSNLATKLRKHSITNRIEPAQTGAKSNRGSLQSGDAKKPGKLTKALGKLTKRPAKQKASLKGKSTKSPKSKNRSKLLKELRKSISKSLTLHSKAPTVIVEVPQDPQQPQQTQQPQQPQKPRQPQQPPQPQQPQKPPQPQHAQQPQQPQHAQQPQQPQKPPQPQQPPQPQVPSSASPVKNSKKKQEARSDVKA